MQIVDVKATSELGLHVPLKLNFNPIRRRTKKTKRREAITSTTPSLNDHPGIDDAISAPPVPPLSLPLYMTPSVPQTETTPMTLLEPWMKLGATIPSSPSDFAHFPMGVPSPPSPTFGPVETLPDIQPALTFLPDDPSTAERRRSPPRLSLMPVPLDPYAYLFEGPLSPLPSPWPSGAYIEKPLGVYEEIFPDEGVVFSPLCKYGLWVSRYLTRLPWISAIDKRGEECNAIPAVSHNISV